MTRRTYYPPREAPEVVEAGPRPVLWGYTLADLDAMARASVIADRSLAMDYHTRFGLAWSAIIDELTAAEEAPHRQSLIRAGWQAIYREVKAAYRSKGYTDDGEAAPRFAAYWAQRTSPSPENPIVERIAVGQIVGTLTGPYGDAVTALAATGDYRAAAETLGITYKTLQGRLSVARRQAIALWHEGETPARVARRTDRRVGAYGRDLATHCGNGHEWTAENTRWYEGRRAGRPVRRRLCRACERERHIRRAAA